MRPVRLWLFVMAGLVALMVLVGGLTRLTDSGLSITEWKPVTGVIPPLSEPAWREEFAKYRRTPEYRHVNAGMTLDQFKVIYWWEWTHRLLGRLVGVAFLLPFVWFLYRGRIFRAEAPRYLVIFGLGAAQGALGWFMVQSGLVERVDVSQYRLAAHLGLALVIFGLILWTALTLYEQPPRRFFARPMMGPVIVGAVFLQMLLGALVAGLKAGLTYNTWPLMDGAWIPSGLFVHNPWYLAAFEDILTVQFNHRLMAYMLFVMVWAHVLARAWRGALPASGWWLAVALTAQVLLGIVTLLHVSALPLAAAHQMTAVLVFTLAVYHAWRLGAAGRAASAR